MKKRDGITLIALVVTIIVLLVLAGISISMLTGQNGILNRAQEAKEKTGTSNAEEKIKIAVASCLIQNNGNLNITNEKLTKALKDEFSEGEYELVNNAGDSYFVKLNSNKIYYIDNYRKHNK